MAGLVIKNGNIFFLIYWFCSVGNGQACSPFHDLSEGVTIECEESSRPSYARYAYMAGEDFVFSQQFLDHTKLLMQRESVFRHHCDVAVGTNIAQLCFYGVYADNPQWKPLDIFDVRHCKGLL